MKHYFLLKDQSSEEAWEILVFNGIQDPQKIQDEIWRLTDEYWEKEDKGEDTGAFCQGEYVVNGVLDKFNGELVQWSNDDVLYY